ncbi:MAG TPA: 2-hydroxyacid dehydrogenase [Candidatus Anaerostipes excrementavium]|uniref:2-hydroxyacid dehydrogenase n=1 Tax=Candidatus Anaerostipes excrementavium TaxID=2838463 RepID=A0A9D1WY27_9FIRM|nr:2-hydroxyacid dehydrogenase [uncultured Anaerostipes sp.]HIX68926.1 2-hydroxyacid dehydrogenase [Candidatus Anaerostipes excrementavium]
MRKCVAVGDMFIHPDDFRQAFEQYPIFDTCRYITWKEDADRQEARAIIRRIETEGSMAYPPDQQLLREIEDAEAVFLHLCPISREVIERAKHLKYILTCRGGVENIDMEAAGENGVTVVNCPEHNAYAVAEYTIGLMICEMRSIARADRALKNGEWREQYPNSGKIREMRNISIGLIGFGTIGRLVAERLKGFGSRILIHDPFVAAEEIEKEGYLPMEKEDLLREADVVSLHGRIGPGEPPLIGAKELKMMKKDAYLINTARAALVDMDALYQALKEEEILGAAIDVFPTEPIAPDDPLAHLDHVTAGNHRGGDTLESYTKAPEAVLLKLQEQYGE